MQSHTLAAAQSMQAPDTHLECRLAAAGRSSQTTRLNFEPVHFWEVQAIVIVFWICPTELGCRSIVTDTECNSILYASEMKSLILGIDHNRTVAAWTSLNTVRRLSVTRTLRLARRRRHVIRVRPICSVCARTAPIPIIDLRII